VGDNDNNPEQGTKRSLSTNIIAYVVVGVIGVITLYQTGMIGGGGKKDNESEGTVAIYDKNATAKQMQADKKKQEKIKDDSIRVRGPKENIEIITLKSQIDSLKRQLRDTVNVIGKVRNTNKKELDDFTLQFNQQMRKFTEVVDKISSDRAMNYHDSGKTSAGNGVTSGVTSGRDDYVNETDIPKLPGVTEIKTGEATDSNAVTFDYVGNMDESPAEVVADKTSNTTNSFNKIVNSSIPDIKTSSATEPKHRQTQAVADKPKYHTIDIAAGSYAKAISMHGVDCPIAGGPASSILSRAPFSLILTTPFRHPTYGDIDAGNATLIGVCYGIRNPERAVFKIEAISYYDSSGKAHYEKANGYVSDGLTHSENVGGTLISTRTSDIAKISAAEGLSALASGLKAYNSQQITNLTSGLQTQNTKNVSTTMVASGFDSAFGQVAQMLSQDAASSIDVIHVDSSHPVEFHVTTPFTVKTLSNNDDIHA